MRTFLALTVITALFTSSAWAGDTAGHTVTVTVVPVNEVAITGGNVSLNIGSTYAAADATTADLTWSTNESDKKITVASSLATIVYPLVVVATGVTGGTAASAVTLSTAAQDLVTGISLTDGTANLSYSATTTAGDGVGVEAHTVTYTILAE
jgi:hypothetical protein